MFLQDILTNIVPKALNAIVEQSEVSQSTVHTQDLHTVNHSTH